VSLGISTLSQRKQAAFSLLSLGNISARHIYSIYDAGGGTINQLPVAVCEREANTAGRVCFLDAKQLLPKARTKASVAMLLFQKNILGRAEKIRYRNGGLARPGKFNLNFRNIISKAVSNCVEIPRKMQICKSPRKIT